MASRLRQAVAPLYLLLCLVLGGSAQGIWANMVLQLLGVAILAWAAASQSDRPLPPRARNLLILAGLALALIAIQLVPLPSSLWPHLGGRQSIAEGYRTLGMALPALPLSLTPYKSFDSLLGLIPPLALFCAIVRLKAYRTSWIAAALLVGTVGGILLGALQVAGGDSLSSSWYLYRETNYGVAVGFFANANHMAILLVISLPFIAALVASARSGNRQRNSAIIVLASGVVVVVVVGIALNRSLAGFGLALPVAVASAMLVLPPKSRLRPWALLLAGLLVVGAVGVIATSATRSGQLSTDAAGSVQTRQEMLATTSKAMRDFLPWGSGLGSFRSVYQLYESRESLTTTYVVHTHDDYVELALETGVPGILLMIAFLLWWGSSASSAWRDADSGAYARAASIASAAILAHSLVDFPLRTAAISAAFAMCLALLIERRPPVARERSDLWPTRHVVLR
jgi:O-antigen ligase